MTLQTPSRRGFITGLISLVAAPAIVRVSSLMPVKAMTWRDVVRAADVEYSIIPESIYKDLVDITRKAFVPRLYVQLHAQNPLAEALHNGAFD